MAGPYTGGRLQKSISTPDGGKVEDQYKRKVLPKMYEPSERTSTMSFKAPMSEEKRQALLKLKETEKEPTGFYGAMNYIMGPMKYLASAISMRSQKEKESEKNEPKKLSPQTRKPVSPKMQPQIQKVSHETISSSDGRDLEPATAQVLSQSGTQIASAMLLNDEVEKMKARERPAANITKDSIEAKKHQALDNIKNALRARQRVQAGLDEKTGKVQTQLLSDGANKHATNMHEVKITSNKYSYRITSSMPRRDPTPPPPPRKRDPNKPQPPPPIRVTSGNANPNEKTIKVKSRPKDRSGINRSAAWSSPKFKKAPKNVANTFESDHNVTETISETVQRSLNKGVPTLMTNNALGRKPPFRHLITTEASANRSNSACIINDISNSDHCDCGVELSEELRDNLLFDANESFKNSSCVELKQSRPLCNSSNNHGSALENAVVPIIQHSSESHEPYIQPFSGGSGGLITMAPTRLSNENVSDIVKAPSPEKKPVSKQLLRTISPLASPSPRTKSAGEISPGAAALKPSKIASSPKKAIKKATPKSSAKSRRAYISTKPKDQSMSFSPVRKRIVKSPVQVRTEFKNVIETVSRPAEPPTLKRKSLEATKSPAVVAGADQDVSLIDNAKAPDLAKYQEIPKTEKKGNTIKRKIADQYTQLVTKQPETDKKPSEQNAAVAKPRYFFQANAPPKTPLLSLESKDKIAVNVPDKNFEARGQLSSFLASAAAIVASAVGKTKQFNENENNKVGEDAQQTNSGVVIKKSTEQSETAENDKRREIDLSFLKNTFLWRAASTGESAQKQQQNIEQTEQTNLQSSKAPPIEHVLEDMDTEDKEIKGVDYYLMQAIEMGDLP